MELTNYWLLVIWIFFGGALLFMAFPQKQEVVLDKNTNRWSIISATLLMLPYIVFLGGVSR